MGSNKVLHEYSIRVYYYDKQGNEYRDDRDCMCINFNMEYSIPKYGKENQSMKYTWDNIIDCKNNKSNNSILDKYVTRIDIRNKLLRGECLYCHDESGSIFSDISIKRSDFDYAKIVLIYKEIKLKKITYTIRDIRNSLSYDQYINFIFDCFLNEYKTTIGLELEV